MKRYQKFNKSSLRLRYQPFIYFAGKSFTLAWKHNLSDLHRESFLYQMVSFKRYEEIDFCYLRIATE